MADAMAGEVFAHERQHIQVVLDILEPELDEIERRMARLRSAIATLKERIASAKALENGRNPD